MKDQKAELTPINDMADMYMLLKQWHTRSIQQAHHLSNIPKGTTVELKISEDETEEPISVTLDGDTHSGFIAGIISTLVIFENLPIHVSASEDMLSESGKSVSVKESVH